MPLQLYTSNRLEILSEILADTIAAQPLPPFEEEIIVVQSRGMARWLSVMLAAHNGILANTAFPFPNVFIHTIFKQIFPDHSAPGFDKELATWHIMQLLPKVKDKEKFSTVAGYLRDNNDVKRLQLSSRIADLFDQYTVYRPDLIKDWDAGKGEDWQAELWRALRSVFPGPHRADLQHDAIIKLRDDNPPCDGLPSRMAIFGVSSLPPYHIDIFHALSRHVEISLYLLNPCEAYWGDIVSDREMARITRQEQLSEEELYLTKGNTLLAATGRLGREFFDMLHNLGAIEYDHYIENAGATLLSCIQNDILHLKEPEQALSLAGRRHINDEDRSIAIHSCHSPMRELEVLRDQLLGIFEEDQAIEPRDVIVMVPDIELYSPLIQAVFAERRGQHAIPYSIADRSVRREGRFIELFLDLLKLTTSRFGVNQVREIIRMPEVYKKFGLTDQDLAVIDRWIKDTRIRWGINGRHRKQNNLPGTEENSWFFGIDRLLLGYAMAGGGELLFENILPFDNIEGGEAQILGNFVTCLETLFGEKAKLEGRFSLEKWAGLLNEMFDACFDRDSIPPYELGLVQNSLGTMAEQAKLTNFNEELGLETVHAYLASALEHVTSPSGFISGGVTFCELLPMRAIPFKVVCLLGLNDKEFPRPDKIFSFNKMAQARRPGDRSLRLEDRYIFLEAMLSARDCLYISYVGQSITDDSKFQPAVPVCELIEYVKRNYTAAKMKIDEQLVTFHPLQPFSPGYFSDDKKLFSFSRSHCDAAAALAGEPQPVPPLLQEKLPEPDESFRHVDLSRLLRFFAQPARYFCQQRLGIVVSGQDETFEEKEFFELGRLESYLLKESLLAHGLKGEDVAARYSLINASGSLPHGALGKAAFQGICNEVAGCADSFRNFLKQDLPPLPFELSLDGFCLSGKLSHIHENGLLIMRCGKISGKDLLQQWLCHLVFNLIAKDAYPLQSLVAGTDYIYTFTPTGKAEELLRDLLAIYWQGLSEPLPFFVKSSYAYAQAVSKGKSNEAALAEAAKAWVGNEFHEVPGEGGDPYNFICFRGKLPFDKKFCDLALQVLLPLLTHVERGGG